MPKIIRDNGLTLVLLILFAGSVIGQAFAGLAAANEERALEGLTPIALEGYLGSGEFLSSLFENWESEFLQMWAYVMLTAYLFQRGSPESRDPDADEPRPGESREELEYGTLWDFLYRHSLGLVLLLLFVASFVLHWLNSARHAADEAVRHGVPPPTAADYLLDPQLWFESFQNWQSEFLSTAVLVVLGIFLREFKSPESKAVGDPHEKTGTEYNDATQRGRRLR